MVVEDSTLYGAMHVLDPMRCTIQNGDQRAWVAIPGRGVRMIASILTDTPKGTLFWTNLTAPQLHNTGLSNRRDLLGAGFLPTWPSSLIGELGLLRAGLEERLSVLADLFAGVMGHVENDLGVSPDNVRGTLAETLRRQYLRELTPQWSKSVQFALQSAAADYNGDRYVRSPEAVMRYHRQSYASRMIATRLPRGAWSELIPPRDPSVIAEWVSEMSADRPMLVRVSGLEWRANNAMARAKVAGIGAGAGGGVGASRDWISSSEFAAIAPHASIEVAGVLAAQGFRTNPLATCIKAVTLGAGPPDRPLAVGPFQLFGHASIGHAAGLLCEAFWQALVAVPKEKPDEVSVWVRSVDRAECLRAAMRIIDTNLPVEVVGFSRGRLWLKVSDEVAGHDHEARRVIIARVAEQTGLVPPVLVPQAPDGGDRHELSNTIFARMKANDHGDIHAGGTLLSAMNVFGDSSIAVQII